MKRYILKPHRVAPVYTLYEALLWVKYRLYFEAEMHEGQYIDDRESNLENEFILESFNFKELQDKNKYFTPDICNKHGLSINPIGLYHHKYAYPYEMVINEALSHYDADHKQMLDEGYSKKEICSFSAMHKELKDYESQLIIFNKQLDENLKDSKLMLYLKLIHKEIMATGRILIDKNQHNDSIKNKSFTSFTLDKIERLHLDKAKEGEYLDELQEIPNVDWNIEYIDWFNSILKTNDKIYYQILIDLDDLIELFPEPIPDTYDNNVTRYSNQFLLDIDETKYLLESRGRKPKYDWAEFYKELDNRYPKTLSDTPKQLDVIVEMEFWCQENWGESPSESSLKEYIKSFFKKNKLSQK